MSFLRRRAREARQRGTVLYVIVSPRIAADFRHLLAEELTYSIVQISERRRKYVILHIDRRIQST